MERSKRAIIIPALNESGTISKVVESVKKFGTVIVIDDGSTDKTAELATTAGAIVCSHGKNRGYEAAIESGFKKAIELGFELGLTYDADGQHDPSVVDQFFMPLEQNTADLVIGIRPKNARISEKAMAVYFNYKFKIKDPLCGMKAYRLNYFAEYGAFDTFKSIGTELALYSLLKGARLSQIPIQTHDRQDNPRFGSIFSANYKIFKALGRVIKYVNSHS